jgi:hypothetical protein
MIGNRIEGSTKLKWNSTTQVHNRSAEIKPLPGIKKTLEDFVRKSFRVTPVPASTHNPRLVVMTESRGSEKKACINNQLKNPEKKVFWTVGTPILSVPYLRLSVRKPFQPVLPSKTRQPVNKGKIKEGQQQ